MLAGAIATPIIQTEAAKVYDRMQSDMIEYNNTLHDRIQYIDSVLAEYGVDSLDDILCNSERQIISSISTEWSDDEIKNYLNGEIEGIWEGFTK